MEAAGREQQLSDSTGEFKTTYQIEKPCQYHYPPKRVHPFVLLIPAPQRRITYLRDAQSFRALAAGPA